MDKVFDCPFCNNAQSVECKLDRINDVGTVSCRIVRRFRGRGRRAARACARARAQPRARESPFTREHAQVPACADIDTHTRKRTRSHSHACPSHTHINTHTQPTHLTHLSPPLSQCGASYSTSINNLTEAIDIFSEWIDESVAVNKGDGGGGEVGAAEAVKAGRAGADSE